MTKNQLTVPEASEEQHEIARRDELVQQVLDDPRELAPSVQVRFAKRVGRPGNSRVMMMDAQTSGPIGDEGEDSESKLALRLADGTNVQLSLSFFNENQPALAGVGGGGGGRRTTFTPFNSYVYEPRTYSVNERESSKLPAIMLSMAFMLGAACYGVFVLTGQVHDQFGILQKLQAAKVVTATAPSKAIAPTKVAAKTPTTSRSVAKVVNEPIPAPPPIALSENAPVKSSPKRAHSSSSRRSHDSEPSVTTHAPRSGRGEFFVPPPPPMNFGNSTIAKGFVPPPPPTPYTVPTGIPAAFDPLQALAPAVAHTNRVYTPPKKVVIEPVSMTSTIETKAPAFEQRTVQRSEPIAVQQIAPSSGERPIVQQFGDAPQLQEQHAVSAP